MKNILNIIGDILKLMLQLITSILETLFPTVPIEVIVTISFLLFVLMIIRYIHAPSKKYRR